MIPPLSYRLQCDTSERGGREREREGGERVSAKEMQESVDRLLGGWIGTANVNRKKCKREMWESDQDEANYLFVHLRTHQISRLLDSEFPGLLDS